LNPVVVQLTSMFATGIKGTGLVLRLQAAPGGGTLITETLSIVADGMFTFPQTVPSLYTYQITIASQPNGQTCTIESGEAAEISDMDVKNVSLTCS
jgi:hypothetical protein